MAKGMRVGYIRVSTDDQNIDRQLQGIELDRKFIDIASGKDTKNRPEYEAMISFLREGDLLIVHSMDRMARNLDDLRKTVLALTKRGIKVEFVTENLRFTGEDTPLSMLLLSVMGAFAEFERNLILERQREGIAIAKKKGLYKGRKKHLTSEQKIELKNMVDAGFSKSKVARHFLMSRESVYRYLSDKA